VESSIAAPPGFRRNGCLKSMVLPSCYNNV
jgi:hypothetical protein